ncbi:GRF-interacting factor 1 [Arachis hypogaea]|uniref:GRF-interacting factor 1 n=1 Tax=Arachis hypogaea TaxID=3818 RepID=UPI000DED3E3D|nr:GRF1-interacting factor 1 [Arachis hypogaea]
MQQQSQQQHLMQMQMQPMMPPYYPNNVTTDHIQQYLDENKSLILKIVESQNSGKLSECAENQSRLQRNLMYLAAIADSQPQQPPAMPAHQYPSSGIMLQGSHYMQAQQQQQQLMAARSSLLYAQQPFSLQPQHGVTSSSTASPALHMLQSTEASMASGGLPDFGRGSTGEGLVGGGGRGLLVGIGSSSAEGNSGDDGN